MSSSSTTTIVASSLTPSMTQKQKSYAIDPPLVVRKQLQAGDCGLERVETAVGEPKAVSNCTKNDTSGKLECTREIWQETELKWAPKRCRGHVIANVSGIIKEMECPVGAQTDDLCTIHRLNPVGNVELYELPPDVAQNQAKTLEFLDQDFKAGKSVIVYVKPSGIVESYQESSRAGGGGGGKKKKKAKKQPKRKGGQSEEQIQETVNQALLSDPEYNDLLNQALVDVDTPAGATFSIDPVSGSASSAIAAALQRQPPVSRVRKTKLDAKAVEFTQMTYDGERITSDMTFADKNFRFSIKDVPGNDLKSLPSNYTTTSGRTLSVYVDYFRSLMSIKATLQGSFPSELGFLPTSLFTDSIAIYESQLLQAFSILIKGQTDFDVNAFLSDELRKYVPSSPAVTYEDGRTTPIDSNLAAYAFGRFQVGQQFVGLIPPKYWAATSNAERQVYSALISAIGANASGSNLKPSALSLRKTVADYPTSDSNFSSQTPQFSVALLEAYVLNLITLRSLTYGIYTDPKELAAVATQVDDAGTFYLSKRLRDYVKWFTMKGPAQITATSTTASSLAQSPAVETAALAKPTRTFQLSGAKATPTKTLTRRRRS